MIQTQIPLQEFIAPQDSDCHPCGEIRSHSKDMSFAAYFHTDQMDHGTNDTSQ